MFDPHFINQTSATADLFHFRRALASDRDPLFTACYADQPFINFYTRFRDGLQQQARGRRLYIIVALATQETILGTGQLIQYPTSAEIADLIVTADWRGRGVGTQLIKYLCGQAAALGWRPVEIGVSATNNRAFALYHRIGFEQERKLTLMNGESANILRLPADHPWLNIVASSTEPLDVHGS